MLETKTPCAKKRCFGGRQMCIRISRAKNETKGWVCAEGRECGKWLVLCLLYGAEKGSLIRMTGYQSRQQEGQWEWAGAGNEGNRIIEVVSRMR